MWMRAVLFAGWCTATLAGCKSDPPPAAKPAPPTGSAAPRPAPAGSAPAMPSDHASDLAKLPPLPPPPAGNPALGTCTFEIAGALAAKETTGGGIGSIALSHWADAEHKAMMYGTGEGFLLNCNGAAATLSFSARSQPADAFPFAPKQYAIGKDSVVRFLGSAGPRSFTNATGTFAITAVDAKHVAGTFDLSAEVVGTGSAGMATIKGTFDMQCPAHCK